MQITQLSISAAQALLEQENKYPDRLVSVTCVTSAEQVDRFDLSTILGDSIKYRHASKGLKEWYISILTLWQANGIEQVLWIN